MNSLDEIFDLFSKKRRRFALYYLAQADRPVPLDELAEQIYEWETHSSSQDIPDDQYDEMMISLIHNHLPKIEDAQHVEYNSDGQQLRITGLSPEADILLSVSKAVEQLSNSQDIVFSDYL